MWEAPMILAVIFIGVAAIVKIAVDAKTRNRLIEKGVADEEITKLYGATSSLQNLSSLKWGMVLVGIGLAVLISRFFPRYVSDEVAWGLMFLFAGLGFLIYYPIAARMAKKHKDQMP